MREGGKLPSSEWRRASGRPPTTWIHQICRDTGVTATEVLELALDKPFWRTIATAGRFGRTPKATPKTVLIDKLEDFVGTPPWSWIDDAAERLSPAEQPLSVSSLPKATEQRRRREYRQAPRFVLDGPMSMHDGVISSRPGHDETLIKPSSGRKTVNGRSEIVRESNINEAARSPQLLFGWTPYGPASFQSISDRPSDVPRIVIVCLPKQNRSFQDEESTVHRSSRRRRNVEVDVDDGLLGIRKLHLIMFQKKPREWRRRLPLEWVVRLERSS